MDSLPPTQHHYNNKDTVNMSIYINKINAFLPHPASYTTVHEPSSNDLELLHDQCFLTPPPSFMQTRPYDLLRPPNSYLEAMNRPDKSVWLAAMQSEMDSLEERNAFEHTSLSIGQKAIRVHWTYDYKYKSDSLIICGKEKACLVAQGFSQ
jgi:hypothetical protein